MFEEKYTVQQNGKYSRVDKKNFIEIMIQHIGDERHRLKKFGKRDIFVNTILK